MDHAKAHHASVARAKARVRDAEGIDWAKILGSGSHDDMDDMMEPCLSLLDLCSSTERPAVFHAAFNKPQFAKLLGPSFWQVLYSYWARFDFIRHRDFQRLFALYRGHWSPDFMSEVDRAHYDALPGKITIYRGQDAAARVGLAWTVDRAVADKFVRAVRTPTIIQAKVRKRNVAAFLSCWGESEVILFRTQAAFGRSWSEVARPSADDLLPLSRPERVGLPFKRRALDRRMTDGTFPEEAIVHIGKRLFIRRADLEALIERARARPPLPHAERLAPQAAMSNNHQERHHESR